MFIPLHDGVPMRRLSRPYVTYTIIGINFAVFVLLGGLPGTEELATLAAIGFGTIPSVLFGTEALPEGLPAAPPWLALGTSMFLHASWLHLIGNMLFLWVFGDNVEDDLGHMRFLAFYLACGVAGSLAHAWMNPDSPRPLIGASGAVSGVVAAYLVLHPRVRLWGLFLKGIPLRLPAYWALGFWIGLQVLQAVTGLDAEVGWYAHLGGLAAGTMLILAFRNRLPLPA